MAGHGHNLDWMHLLDRPLFRRPFFHSPLFPLVLWLLAVLLAAALSPLFLILVSWFTH